MEAYYAFLNELINKNSDHYNKKQEEIRWVNTYEAYELEDSRSSILKSIENKTNWEFKNTKPWVNSISKGCKICGEGQWSCLFITGLCNAKCFYCPAAQNKEYLPSTQQLTFERADDYVDYINHFGFKGVSLSGGEPLLSFEKTLEFITAIRKKCNSDVYIWMYTNGILAEKENFKRLADAGLNEVRFDIGATNYKLDSIKFAKNIIENITIEIPAVPEEIETLKNLLPSIVEAGVTNLNLHQLRLTNYNSPKLLKRNYTYLHGEQAVVVESELAALAIMKEVVDKNIPIGVNYCCFQFKNRFQKAGYRKIIASKLIDNFETITERGYLRSIYCHNTILPSNIDLNDLLEDLNDDDDIQLRYKSLILEDENLSQLNNSLNLRIKEKNYALSSFNAVEDIQLSKSEFAEFIKMINDSGEIIPDNKKIFTAWRYEFIESGWRNYF